jgi:hypothetical protein
MRSFQVSQSVAANSTVNDIFTAAGINAFFGEASGITYYANGNAIGRPDVTMEMIRAHRAGCSWMNSPS